MGHGTPSGTSSSGPSGCNLALPSTSTPLPARQGTFTLELSDRCHNGIDSDLPVMLSATRILDALRIPFELTIVSAHCTPDRMVQYARDAAARGLPVIIAGAGGAAHLPGMVQLACDRCSSARWS